MGSLDKIFSKRARRRSGEAENSFLKKTDESGGVVDDVKKRGHAGKNQIQSRRDFLRKTAEVGAGAGAALLFPSMTTAKENEKTLESKKESSSKENLDYQFAKQEELSNLASSLSVYVDDLTTSLNAEEANSFSKVNAVFDFLKKEKDNFPILSKELTAIKNNFQGDQLREELVRKFAGEGYFINLLAKNMEGKAGSSDILVKGEVEKIALKDLSGVTKFFDLKAGEKMIDYVSISDKELKPLAFNTDGVQFVNQASFLSNYKKIRKMAKNSPGWKDASPEDIKRGLLANEMAHRFFTELYDREKARGFKYKVGKIDFDLDQMNEFFSDVSDIGTDRRGSFRVMSNALSNLEYQENAKGRNISVRKEGNWYYLTNHFMFDLLGNVFAKKEGGQKFLKDKISEIMEYSNKGINFSFNVDIPNESRLRESLDAAAKETLISAVDEQLEGKRDEIKAEIFAKLTENDLNYIQQSYEKAGGKLLKILERFRREK